MLRLIRQATPTRLADAEMLHQVPHGAGAKILDCVYAARFSVRNGHFKAIPEPVVSTRSKDEWGDWGVQIQALWGHACYAVKEEVNTLGSCAKLRVLEGSRSEASAPPTRWVQEPIKQPESHAPCGPPNTADKLRRPAADCARRNAPGSSLGSVDMPVLRDSAFILNGREEAKG